MTHKERTWVMLGFAAALAGCSGGDGSTSGGSGGSSTGRLSVSLMDAPVDGVSEVNLQIAAIWVKTKAEGPPLRLPLPNAPVTVDLLSLTDENAAVLIDGAVVPAGEYEWLAMDVNAAHDNVFDSYAVKNGGQHEIFVPSGRVRLVSGFEVGANQAVRFLFDWDLRKGLIDPPGLPGYLLKPAFRVLEVAEYGVLTGEVAMALVNDVSCTQVNPDPNVGNFVYVYEGLGVDPFDLDDSGPQPVASVPVVQRESGEFTYRAVLTPGEYTVAFTCRGEADDPEDGGDDLDFSTAADAVIAGNAPTVVDFE